VAVVVAADSLIILAIINKLFIKKQAFVIAL
jgi:hypothetical protein